jgi:hypothetical protein
MSGKRIGGIVCCALGAWFLGSAVVTVFSDPGVADPSGLGVSRAVGAFLPGLAALIVGLWLFEKPKQS